MKGRCLAIAALAFVSQLATGSLEPRPSFAADWPTARQPGKVVATAAAGQAEPLRYAWTIGRTYVGRIEVEAEISGRTLQSGGGVVLLPTSEQPESADNSAGSGEASGSGFLVGSTNVLVTCAHVVRGAVQMQAQINGKPRSLKLLAFDSPHDLAILKVEGPTVPGLAISSLAIEPGQEVHVVGYPLSDVLGESAKVTRGAVSGIVERKDGNLLQVDAGINPGNSGGPLVDNQGRVLGVASAKLAGQTIDRVGFAVPSEQVLALLKKHRVALPDHPAGQPLDGPELFRRVTPCVALLKVQLGRGGIGATEQRVVRYSVHTTSSSGSSRSFMPLSGGGQQGGRLVVDAFGEVAAFVNDNGQPFSGDPLGPFGVERLSSDGLSEWDTMRSISLVHTEKEESSSPDDFFPGPRMPMGPSRMPFGPRFRPGSPFRGFGEEPKTKVTVTTAMEEVHYRLGESSADGTVSIYKEYKLYTLPEKKDAAPELEVKGNGTITWDRKQGIPRRSKLKLALTGTTQNVTVRVPMTLSYEFSSETTESLTRKAKDLAKSAGVHASKTPEKIAPKTPPSRVRKIEPSDSAPTTAKRSSRIDSAPSGGGLSLFEPDEPAPPPKK